jgi:hypothetical protein
MVKSDPADWEIWQAYHATWTRLIGGKGSAEYRELLIDKKDLDLGNGVMRGSSTSKLSDTQALERGYLGGR